MRTLRLRTMIAGLVVLAAACTSTTESIPPPRSTISTIPRSTTTRPDLSGVTLDTVRGETTTTLRQQGGAVLQGIVEGPEGPVASATVRVERLVVDAVQPVDVFTIEDGTWQLVGVPGGRYRVRAYRAPDLAMAQGQVLFLADDERAELRLSLQTYDGLEVRNGVTPTAPIVGQSVNLAVRVTDRSVDAEGIGQSTPLAGLTVEVRAAGWEPIDPDEPTIADTDADGRVVFEYRCPAVGPVTATAIVGPDRITVPLSVPDCRPVPTTTTTTTAPSSTTTAA